MADFKTPNLCGANETLNDALSKIKNLKDEILAQSTALPSVKKAAFESKLTELKSSLDGLAVDLPESKPVNLQSEITSLINDVDRKTAQGIAAFNAKVAALKKDFGGALSDKGLDLDKLIDEGTTKLGKDISAATDFLTGTGEGSLTGELTQAFGLSGESVNISSGSGLSGVPGNISEYVAPTTTAAGGNLCDLIPNLEIPADLAGTGVTTKEIEDRVSNATTLTLSETPKEILSVQGKKTTQSFFTNIQYKQNGKIIVPNATGTFDTIKATYTVDLIKEKPIAAKQADVPPEKEEVSIVSANSNAVDTKTFSNFGSLLKKLNTKSVLGLATEKEKTDLETAISSIGSPTLKSQMNADLAKANAFLSGKGPGTLSGEISSSLNGPVDSNGKQSVIKVTTPKDASTVTIEKVTKVNPTTQKLETVEVKKTTRAPLSSKGFTNRKVEITESFWFESLPKSSKLYEDGVILDWDLLSEPITPAKGIKLKHRPVLITDMLGRQYNPDGQSWVEWVYRLGGSSNNTRAAYLEASDTVTFFSGNYDFDVAACSSQAIVITYEYYEKIDPSVKG